MGVIPCWSFDSIIYEVPSNYLISHTVLFLFLQWMCVQATPMLYVGERNIRHFSRLVILHQLTSERQQGRRWSLICRVCLVGKEVPPLLISPCSDCWVLVKMSMLVRYAGKPWGGVTVTDRDVASAAACRGGRRYFVSLEIQKKIINHISRQSLFW